MTMLPSRSVVLFLALVSLLASHARAQCLRNLTQVALQEVFVRQTEFRREYVLCQRTTFETGILNRDGDVEAGFFPLAVRGNSTVKCGRLGRRDRECVIAFGSVGLLLAPFERASLEPIDYGVTRFIGLTFDDLITSPVFADLAYGTIIFEDCAFLNSISEPNIQLSSTAEFASRNRRDLRWTREYRHQHNNFTLPNFSRHPDPDVPYEYVERRRMQVVGNANAILNVEFINCLFQDNRAPRAFTRDAGLTLIYMPGPNVNIKIRRSTFSFNNYQQYSAEFRQAITKSLLSSFGDNNEFIIEDNCFNDNNAFGYGLMNSVSTAVTLNNNFVANLDPALGCDFWGFMLADPNTGFLELADCTPPDATSCILDIPTLAPSAAPTRKSSFCVSANSIVQVQDTDSGTIIPTRIADVSMGDNVLVGNGQYEEVYGFAHHHEDLPTDYLQVFAKIQKNSNNDRPLEITADHMVMTKDGEAVPAGTLNAGSELVLQDGTTAVVTKIRTVTRRGLYGPLTPSGQIVVDGIMISTFVALQPDTGYLRINGFTTPMAFQWMGMAFEAPHRLYSHYFGLSSSWLDVHDEQGFSGWVRGAYDISQFFIQQPPVIMALLCIPTVLFLLTVSWVEGLVLGHALAWGVLVVAAIVGKHLVSQRLMGGSAKTKMVDQ